MKFEYFIGNRYLKSKQQQTFISLITVLSIAGVCVGVMALIIVIGVMSGFEADLKSRILGVESHVVVLNHTNDFTNYKNVMKTIDKVDGVTASTPFIYSQVIIRTASGVSGAILRGIDPNSASSVIKNVDAKLLTFDPKKDKKNTKGIILGKELATNMGVMPGDTVFLISPKGMLTPIGHMPSMKRFKVVGLFESGMYEYDSTISYINLKDAQKMLRMGNSITGIEIRISNIDKAQKIAKTISKKLGFPYWARDWMQMNYNLFSALKLEKTAMFIILTLIVLVAAFNIASSLIMMVKEKTKDIAILKAMGATNKTIRKIFVYKGMSIGVIGTVLGASLGFLLCSLLQYYKFIELPGKVYYITTLPVKLETLDVLIISVSALLICFFATLYPAHQASKLNPVEAIRYG